MSAAAMHSNEIDQSVLETLPSISTIDGSEESYFMKESLGHRGREALKREFEGTLALHNLAPELASKPIGWGSCQSKPDTHFYICKFYDLEEELPEKDTFCERLAALHTQHRSPHDNTFADTWEVFFINGLKDMFALNRERGGESKELEALIPDPLNKVVPRLLRPLETGGNSIKPWLVHGDLWYGNAANDLNNNRPIIFDPYSFWAHNEYELGNWRPERYKFSQCCFDAYHTHFPKTSPVEDYDDRNALYALRFNLHVGTLFSTDTSCHESVIDDGFECLLDVTLLVLS